MANPTQELSPTARYGGMAFDAFIMERWDRAADASQDKQQWDSLARQYLAMKPRDREPYHKEALRQRQRMATDPGGAAAELAADVIVTRVLPAMQTVQERNFCSRKLTHQTNDTALVRTHYGARHDAAYAALARAAVGSTCVKESSVWDDQALYDVGDDWPRVLLRVPELGDELATLGEADYYEGDGALDRDPPPASDRDALEAWLWDRRLATRLYVADREALENGMLKVFYLDPHGNAVWSHKFSTKVLLEYEGAWLSMSLAEINESFSLTRENGSELSI
ncbi:hypothetical protein F4781DRAFT_442916 [Annulohypoxylon bovei var. microspora]|nr:hypothetical protein F4781DRAFT_442916 [Annulohypoxylon bovei var. microspora]